MIGLPPVVEGADQFTVALAFPGLAITAVGLPSVVEVEMVSKRFEVVTEETKLEAVTATLKVTVAVGHPDSSPAAESSKPGGSVPAANV